jgi:hypothetical protein
MRRGAARLRDGLKCAHLGTELLSVLLIQAMGVGQGVAMDSPGPAMPYASTPCFGGGPPIGRAACGRLLPLWTPPLGR